MSKLAFMTINTQGAHNFDVCTPKWLLDGARDEFKTQTLVAAKCTSKDTIKNRLIDVTYPRIVRKVYFDGEISY